MRFYAVIQIFHSNYKSSIIAQKNKFIKSNRFVIVIFALFSCGVFQCHNKTINNSCFKLFQIFRTYRIINALVQYFVLILCCNSSIIAILINLYQFCHIHYFYNCIVITYIVQQLNINIKHGKCRSVVNIHLYFTLHNFFNFD